MPVSGKRCTVVIDSFSTTDEVIVEVMGVLKYVDAPNVQGNIIKPLLENGVQSLNKNLFIANVTEENPYFVNNFTDDNSHHNVIYNNAINCKLGKFSCYNVLTNAESCELEDDCINIKANNANGLKVEDNCYNLTITRSNNCVYTKIGAYQHDKTLTITSDYNHYCNKDIEINNPDLTRRDTFNQIFNV